MLLTFSQGIDRITGLSAFLGAPVRYRYSLHVRRNYSGVVGWGLKHTSVKAQAYAKKYNLPYIALEDGFLRSVGLGVNGAIGRSMVVDFTGIYYDSTQPSDLESLIINANYSPEQLERACAAIALIKTHRLSKYNHAPDLCPVTLGVELEVNVKSERVLVVDQTYGDVSIELGCANGESFERMLLKAIADNPGAQIVVKTHPDVVAGKKQGYLNLLAVELGCTLLSEDVNPWAILDQVDKVYVVTSQLGFEALMGGKEVHCFGMPFYAGWGLTIDQVNSKRRGHNRSLAELFYAAYIEYCRYLDLKNFTLSDIENTIAALVAERGVNVNF
ncbi:MAG: capsular polysaccharide export protein, LipB/KpsS family [Pseudomonadales bacterium]|jgi:capsular polysaccharide export protein